MKFHFFFENINEVPYYLSNNDINLHYVLATIAKKTFGRSKFTTRLVANIMEQINMKLIFSSNSSNLISSLKTYLGKTIHIMHYAHRKGETEAEAHTSLTKEQQARDTKLAFRIILSDIISAVRSYFSHDPF